MTSTTAIAAAIVRILGTAAAVATLGASAAHAACAQWEVSGAWTIAQTNGYLPKFTLTQRGAELQGKAEYTVVTPSCAVTATCRPTRGSADGTITGNAFKLNVYWGNGTIGIYSGTVGAQGRIEGTTQDKMNPRSMASWYSKRTFSCAAAAPDRYKGRRIYDR